MFLTVLCCSSVSDVGLVVVVAFEAVVCCISMGDVGVRLFFGQICKIHFMRQFYVPQSGICTSHLLDKRFN